MEILEANSVYFVWGNDPRLVASVRTGSSNVVAAIGVSADSAYIFSRIEVIQIESERQAMAFVNDVICLRGNKIPAKR